jgi:hypothetical protein
MTFQTHWMLEYNYIIIIIIIIIANYLYFTLINSQ